MKKRLFIFILFLLIVICFILSAIYFFHYFENEIENTLEQNYVTSENLTNETSNIIVVELPKEIEETNYEDDLYNGIFELPLNGTSAFASISMPLYNKIPVDSNAQNNIIKTLNPRHCFCNIKRK